MHRSVRRISHVSPHSIRLRSRTEHWSFCESHPRKRGGSAWSGQLTGLWVVEAAQGRFVKETSHDEHRND